MFTKKEIVESCTICNGVGFYDDIIPCSCTNKFRSLTHLKHNGFEEGLLEVISNNYELPFIENGDKVLDFYLNNFEKVSTRGLSILIYSQARGRGKTTLAHYISYCYMYYWLSINSYSRSRVPYFYYVDDLINTYDTVDNWRNGLLVIDDLCREDRSAPWKKDKGIVVLNNVFQYRRNKNLPTIITSNYMPVSISSFYDSELDSLLEIGSDGSFGGSIFKSIELGGVEDYRLSEDKWGI